VTTSPPLRDKIAFTVMGTSLEAPKPKRQTFVAPENAPTNASRSLLGAVSRKVGPNGGRSKVARVRLNA
jgi:hypothetical protein